MSGYLFFTAKTPEVCALLDKLNGAGSSQHNTSEWQTPENWYTPEGEPPRSLNENIQAAADKLDDQFTTLTATNQDLLTVLELVWDTCCSSPTSTPSKKALLAVNAALAKPH